MLDFGREVTSHPELARTREWLVTNGIGGYACGTLSGALSRVYHGWLVAAQKPPLGRQVLLTKVEEIADYAGTQYALTTDVWTRNRVEPKGYLHLERFRLVGTRPIWTYAFADARLEKTIWMDYGENTTLIRYIVTHALHPVALTLRAIVNDVDSHHVAEAIPQQFHIKSIESGVQITRKGSTPFYIYCDNGEATFDIQRRWQRQYVLDVEKERGLPHVTAHWVASDMIVRLQAGQSVTIVASTKRQTNIDSLGSLQAFEEREQGLITQSQLQDAPLWIQQLVLAADQFIVKRRMTGQVDGRSVIAGYHWFSDWGRDTMIALPGLTLATRRYDEASKILRTFAQFVSEGMLPNRFPDAGEVPEYNTVDATLWYFEAISRYYDATGDGELLRDLFPILQDIIAWHQRGTRYQIKVDATDGLLYSGQADVQLTWMDVKIKDWVVTPRTGKAVEINALWYNALRCMADFSRLLGEVDADEYDTAAILVERHFHRFWNVDAGYCYDVIDTPQGKDDDALRPNQLFAISLTYSPLNKVQSKAIVDACSQHLLTSMGLRTLAPFHPDYKGDYGGDPVYRDSRYHQGTVWAWLIGAYVVAYLNTYGDSDQAQAFLEPFRHHLADAGIGTISEVAQGNAPHLPKATIAQAWSVAEVLRAWLRCEMHRVAHSG